MDDDDAERIKAQVLAAADVLKTASATTLTLGILLPIATETLSYKTFGIALLLAILLFVGAELVILEAHRRR